MAVWEAAFLPDWKWEAYEKEEEGLYFGRVKSPNTYGNWEYGSFSQEQLEKAGVYRTDLDPEDDKPLFPDGGVSMEVARLYETELDALLEEGDEEFKR